jgi:hypothetical protein
MERPLLPPVLGPAAQGPQLATLDVSALDSHIPILWPAFTGQHPLFPLPPATSHRNITELPVSLPTCLFLHSNCALDPDSLDPLAQLASLRELSLFVCTGVTLASLERLISTSEQGCLLEVSACACLDSPPAETCSQMRQRVLAQRGSRDTPVLVYE